MVTFHSFGDYVAAAISLADRIARMQAIILALEMRALDAAGAADWNEYNFDDGQTKIRATYRNPGDIAKAIEGYQRLLNKYVKRLTGSGVQRLVDSKNFRS